MSRVTSATTESVLSQLLSGENFPGKKSRNPAEVCYAILIAEGTGSLKDVPAAKRTALVEFLHECQNPESGLFIASSAQRSIAAPENVTSLRHTYLALHALNALDSQPGVPLRFLDGFRDVETIFAWAVRGPDQPVRSSERLMFLLSCLVSRSESEHRNEATGLYHAVLDELDARQDRSSGLWLKESGGSLAFRAWAAANLAPFYGYVHRPLLQAGRKIDLLLEILATSSPLLQSEQDSRESYAASIHLLAMLGNVTTYRSADVTECLDAASQTLASGRPVPVRAGNTPSCFDEATASSNDEEVQRVAALHSDWTSLSALAAAQYYTGRNAVAWEFRRWPGLNYFWRRGILDSQQGTVLPLWVRHPSVRPFRAGASPSTVQPRVAVVIPCYNMGIYLPEALDSVRAQSWKNIEIIVVDDGSTDEVTRRFLQVFDQEGIQALRQVNQGLAAARNAGIRQSTADFICCLDPDDRLAPAYLERGMKILLDDSSVGFVTSYYTTFDERADLVANPECGFPELLAENCAMVSALFRKTAFEQAGGYFDGFPVPGFEDWDLWIRLVELGWRAHVIQEPLFAYRVRPDSMYRMAGRDEGKLEQTVHTLVSRHRASYEKYAPDVVSKMRLAMTRLQDFIRFESRSRAWGDNQLNRWQIHAKTQEQRIASLNQRIDELEKGKQWLEEQLESWKDLEGKSRAVIQQQKDWIEQLEQGKRWLEQQYALSKPEGGATKAGPVNDTKSDVETRGPHD